MRKISLPPHFKRILYSLLFCVAGCLLTFLYFSNMDFYSQGELGPPLAHISSSENLIRKKHARHRLWQQVEMGDSLFDSESLKTNIDSEAQVVFEGSDRIVYLEPETLITIRKQEKEVSLDLIEGALSVEKAKDLSALPAQVSVALTVNSKNGKIDISQTKASFRKSDNDEIDLQILEGEAQLQTPTGAKQVLPPGPLSRLSRKGMIQPQKWFEIKSPLPNQKLYRAADKNPTLNFIWKPTPTDEKVELLLGTHSRQMTPVPWLQTANGQGEASVPFGRLFFKLRKLSPTGEVLAESNLQKIEISQRRPPQLNSPQSRQVINEKQKSISFSWENLEKYKGLSLQISDTQDFKNLILNEKVNPETDQVVKKLEPGHYFARLGALVSYENEKNNDWIYGMATEFFFASTPKIEAASTVASPPELNWSPALNEIQNFVHRPQLTLEWSSNQNLKPFQYRVHLRDEFENKVSFLLNASDGASVQKNLKKPGRYIASIEALNQQGDLLAKTEEKSFSIQELARINAPDFTNPSPFLQAALDGSIKVEWSPPEGAKEYILQISKINGPKIKKWKQRLHFAEIKNLSPGSYEIEATAIDAYGRPSLDSTKKEIRVQDQSHLNAPKLRKIIQEERE